MLIANCRNNLIFILISSFCVIKFGDCIKCEIETFYSTNPSNVSSAIPLTYCILKGFNLTTTNKNSIPTFENPQSELETFNGIQFRSSKVIEVAPNFTDLKKQLPQLTIFSIYRAGNLKTIKNDLFDESFKDLQDLEIGYSGVRKIEKGAFRHLINLRQIYVTINNIDSLPYNIFEHNQKLEVVCFMDNQITSISPTLLTGLRNLKIVYFGGNECISSDFIGTELIYSSGIMEKYLQTCYSNCQKQTDNCEI